MCSYPASHQRQIANATRFCMDVWAGARVCLCAYARVSVKKIRLHLLYSACCAGDQRTLVHILDKCVQWLYNVLIQCTAHRTKCHSVSHFVVRWRCRQLCEHHYFELVTRGVYELDEYEAIFACDMITFVNAGVENQYIQQKIEEKTCKGLYRSHFISCVQRMLNITHTFDRWFDLEDPSI